jgi:hypothetical protein
MMKNLPRMAAWLMSGFALLALTLGCIGLYGAVSHAVARRSRELAIRGTVEQAYQFEDADHFTSQWSFYKDGREDWMEEIHYERIR